MKILRTSKLVNLEKSHAGIFTPCNKEDQHDLVIDDNGNTEYYSVNGDPKAENKIILNGGEIKLFPSHEYLDSY